MSTDPSPEIRAYHLPTCPMTSPLSTPDSRQQADPPPAPLPHSGIALLQLGDDAGEGHWPTAVIPWVMHEVCGGRPVFFVESGGMLYYVSGPVVANACAHDPLLRVHDDQDLTVYTPSNTAVDVMSHTDIHGRRYYDCNVPTMINIRRDLEAHEQAHDDAVVVFDDAVMLRPYWTIRHPEYASGEPPLQLTPAQVSGWRASDLLDFAEHRHSPTVIVYDATAGGDDDLRSLLAISVLHVHYRKWSPGDTRLRVEVSRRRTLIDAWSRPEHVTVSLFESRC